MSRWPSRSITPSTARRKRVTARPACTKSSARMKARPACRSTARTACTARPATSRIRPRTSGSIIMEQGGLMSGNNINAKIRSNPKFAELVGKRTRFAIILSLIVLLPYYSYMLVVSLQPQLLASKVSDGSVITIGWPLAALIVIGGWLLTGVYVSRANGEFDRLNEEILKEARK